LPPERRRYTLKRFRVKTRNWLIKKLTGTWEEKTNHIAHVASLGTARTSRLGSFRYHSYCHAERKHANRIKNRKSAMSMRLIMLTCMTATTLGRATAFDCDSKRIAIDNCSSRCLTNSRLDYLPGTVKRCNMSILGVGGTIECSVKGTVSWTIEDDQGRAHDLVIPDTPLCDELPHRLFSPQHWAQET
jgi:hypothetical protein